MASPVKQGAEYRAAVKTRPRNLIKLNRTPGLEKLSQEIAPYSSLTGDVTTRNTRSTSPVFEIACSTPGGEQQMVAVARAMSGNVKLLLLDEPFEGLAPAVTLELFSVFDRLRRHMGIVIVEHNLDLVLALADRVFALERGAVFHQGPASALLEDLEYRKEILWL